MSPETRKFRAADARQLLENAMFKEAFEAVDEYLNAAALACNPDDAEKARRIVISKQILAAVKREIARVVEDGAVAEIQIQEIEKQRKLRLFRR